jgi:acyl-CoA thioesterase
VTTDDIMLRSRFVGATGASLEEKGSGFARMSLVVRPDLTGFGEELHGGVLTALMDSTLAVALRELRGEAAGLHSSIEMNASFLGPAREGDKVTVEGEISHMSSGVAFGEASAYTESGGLIARGRVTFALQPAKD